MRGPRLLLLEIGEDQKKRSSMFVMRPLIFSEAPIFLVGPRFQPT